MGVYYRSVGRYHRKLGTKVNMGIRREYKDGEHLIECAICGETKHRSEIKLGARTQLPMCTYHADENYESLEGGVQPPIQRPANPSNEPEDKFITFETPDE